MSSTPIADHALLSDCHSAALVTHAGSVDWLCFPRFDSAATFARLLDDGAGHFSLAPSGEFRATRRYLDKTMVLALHLLARGGLGAREGGRAGAGDLHPRRRLRRRRGAPQRGG